jgi:SulP family sulfate permease
VRAGGRGDDRVRFANGGADAERYHQDHGLDEATHARANAPLELADMDVFKGRKADTMADLAGCIAERRFAPGGTVFSRGDESDEIYFIRKGAVRISLAAHDKILHVATFGRGDFFGEIAFLDGGARSANATAETATTLFVISRKRFDKVANVHPRLAHQIFASLAHTLGLRLRQADGAIIALEES